MKRKQTLIDRIDHAVFSAIYGRSLVYNTCWEDPAVDRQALGLRPDDTVMVITSAGCNALDYALTGVRKVFAVDANPRQNALLELKIAAIRHLEFDDFSRLFGEGRHPGFPDLYRQHLRAALSPFAREFWDARQHWFDSRHGSFYFHGLAGIVARAFRFYFTRRPALAKNVAALFEAQDMAEQRRIYAEQVRPHMWGPLMNWIMNRQFTMNLLGVPHPQRKEVQTQHPEGIAGFIRESVEYVVNELPMHQNYFWRLYFGGRYTRDCCPEYLKPDNFQALKAGLVDTIECHTMLITDFLRAGDTPISKFILLDHMDWMSCYYPDALREEWQALMQRAAPGARLIFRSAHARPGYLDSISIDGIQLRDCLTFHDDLAEQLTRQDRVHTYAGFHIADVRA